MVVDDRPRMDLATARSAAERLVALLAPACLRIVIAGSVRRLTPAVKDVEIVAAPRFRIETVDLFGEREQAFSALDELLGAMQERGEISRREVNGRPSWGDRYKRLWFGEVPVDLFIARPPAQFGVLELIRTGSAQFSQRFVSTLPSGMRCENGALFRGGELLQTPTEADAFRAAGWPSIPAPEWRVS